MIPRIKGLKYPDSYFIRFFFYHTFHQKRHQTFIEFGCGSGNNLSLPYQYDHNVIGIDFNPTSIQNAQENFTLFQSDATSRFYYMDMREFPARYPKIQADVFSLPNIVNYLTQEDFIRFLDDAAKYRIYKPHARFFIRFRTPRDFRYGLGKRLNSQCYAIETTNDITGEAGALNCFYTESQMVAILQKYLRLEDYKIFHIDFENIIKNGDTVLNSDIVIWGSIL